MNLKRNTTTRAAAIGATTALLGLLAAAPSSAAGNGDVAVANTETVQVYMSANGEPEEQRVYEQLAFTGNGTVTVSNPVSTEGLRNLDGFGGFDVEGDRQVAEVAVDGERRLRTVSDFTGELPLDVDVTYLLDGEEVEPGDVVGEAGVLEVRYRVTNTTGEMREVSFDDGTGRQVTEQAEVVIPMVGSLTTTLPSTFTDVRSDEANMAGDGRGGTKLSFTMTLFPPIGSDTAEFGYQAEIVDGVVPAATISALPVNPLQSPAFSRGADRSDQAARRCLGAQRRPCRHGGAGFAEARRRRRDARCRSQRPQRRWAAAGLQDGRGARRLREARRWRGSSCGRCGLRPPRLRQDRGRCRSAREWAADRAPRCGPAQGGYGSRRARRAVPGFWPG